MWSIKKCLSLFLLFFCLSIPSAQAEGNHWPEKLNTKVHNVLNKYLKSEAYALKAIAITGQTEKESVLQLNDNLFQVNENGKKTAYLYVAQAPSKHEVFDYMVLFNTKMEITKAKVLIYREEHGRQIGSVRWLKQFNGMGIDSSPSLNEEIDGISGATISANNMTVAVKKLLASLKVAMENGDI